MSTAMQGKNGIVSATRESKSDATRKGSKLSVLQKYDSSSFSEEMKAIKERAAVTRLITDACKEKLSVYHSKAAISDQLSKAIDEAISPLGNGIVEYLSKFGTTGQPEHASKLDGLAQDFAKTLNAFLSPTTKLETTAVTLEEAQLISEFFNISMGEAKKRSTPKSVLVPTEEALTKKSGDRETLLQEALAKQLSNATTLAQSGFISADGAWQEWVSSTSSSPRYSSEDDNNSIENDSPKTTKTEMLARASGYNLADLSHAEKAQFSISTRIKY